MTTSEHNAQATMTSILQVVSVEDVMETMDEIQDQKDQEHPTNVSTFQQKHCFTSLHIPGQMKIERNSISSKVLIPCTIRNNKNMITHELLYCEQNSLLDIRIRQALSLSKNSDFDTNILENDRTTSPPVNHIAR
uniref:Uncharacterized protein n=1 Tax=Guillardia theta TaxID=55529 RepID=A0A7S4JG66_GUITH|mmetsp:Transcript_16141/g.54077  ORF Transcript_16141/g.54077 Transcript_16141/m.54077 type:complete len:135 (+) Transcript_16141:77-481(+)